MPRQKRCIRRPVDDSAPDTGKAEGGAKAAHTPRDVPQLGNVVIAANGSPHKLDRCPSTPDDPRSKHRRYYERNRELVRARQQAAYRRRREAEGQGETP